MSTAVATVRAHPDKYERDFDAVVTFLIQYINKRAPTPSVKVASVAQTRPAKQHKTNTSHGTFKGKIELKKYFREEYGLMLMAKNQQLYELQKKANLIKGKKTQESSSALRARVAMLEAKSDNSSDESLFVDESPKLVTGIIQPLTEREIAPARAMQILDGQGHQKGTVSLVS